MSTSCLSFAVLGATGKTGGRAARQLLSSGHKVRAVVRNASSESALELRKLGAELFEVKPVDDGNTSPFATNESQLTVAFTGVDGAFILVPPHLTSPNINKEAFEFIDHVKRAVIASKIPKVVLLSSYGAQHQTGTGIIEKLHHLEQTFNEVAKDSALAVVAVRAGYFFSNILNRLAAVPHGFLPGIIMNPNLKINFIDAADIGDQVAKSLLDGSIKAGESRVVELAGPEDLTTNEVVKIISDIVGKEVKYSPTPREEQQKLLEGHGFSADGASQLISLAIGMENEVAAFENPSYLVRGRVHFKDYLTKALKK